MNQKPKSWHGAAVPTGVWRKLCGMKIAYRSFYEVTTQISPLNLSDYIYHQQSPFHVFSPWNLTAVSFRHRWHHVMCSAKCWISMNTTLMELNISEKYELESWKGKFSSLTCKIFWKAVFCVGHHLMTPAFNNSHKLQCRKYGFSLWGILLLLRFCSLFICW